MIAPRSQPTEPQAPITHGVLTFHMTNGTVLRLPLANACPLRPRMATRHADRFLEKLKQQGGAWFWLGSRHAAATYIPFSGVSFLEVEEWSPAFDGPLPAPRDVPSEGTGESP
jgi:hypothetical protein